MFRFSILLLASVAIASAFAAEPNPDGFRWGNANVYFVITDRFCNGDSLNDVNYDESSTMVPNSSMLRPFMAAISRECFKKPARDISRVLASMWYG